MSYYVGNILTEYTVDKSWTRGLVWVSNLECNSGVGWSQGLVKEKKIIILL